MNATAAQKTPVMSDAELEALDNELFYMTDEELTALREAGGNAVREWHQRTFEASANNKPLPKKPAELEIAEIKGSRAGTLFEDRKTERFRNRDHEAITINAGVEQAM